MKTNIYKNKIFGIKSKLFLLILLLVFAAIVNASSSDFNPRVDAWDYVEEWEIVVCSKWGGTETAQQGATSTNNIALSHLTLTLQAKKIEYPDNKTVYTVSYYIEPLDKKQFAVRLFNTQNNAQYIITPLSIVSYSSPATGYKVVHLNQGFDTAQISYGSTNSIENIITIPIVDITGYYHINNTGNTGLSSGSSTSSDAWAGWK